MSRISPRVASQLAAAAILTLGTLVIVVAVLSPQTSSAAALSITGLLAFALAANGLKESASALFSA